MESMSFGKKKIIHVNQHIIRANLKKGENNPPVTVRCGGKTLRGMEITIHGPSKVVYRPEKPLSCGARLWIETYYPVQLV